MAYMQRSFKTRKQQKYKKYFSIFLRLSALRLTWDQTWWIWLPSLHFWLRSHVACFIFMFVLLVSFFEVRGFILLITSFLPWHLRLFKPLLSPPCWVLAVLTGCWNGIFLCWESWPEEFPDQKYIFKEQTTCSQGKNTANWTPHDKI